MKLSGYYKAQGHNVELKLDYKDLNQYDKVFISKVFSNTKYPQEILELPNVEYGGTGFFYDEAPPLPDEIEHHMPDYHLYNSWVNEQIKAGGKRKDFEYYLDHSIGYLTRRCFRGCYYCVNRKYKKVIYGSPLNEFLDTNRKYICLLDDNFFGYKEWKPLLQELQKSGKRFQFKQGLDERLLTEERVKMLNESKYYGDYIFAFDNIEDKEIITRKIQLWRKYCDKSTKFYVFCGSDKNDQWDYDFWVQDLKNTFERISILMQYGCIPYIMRFNRYKESPYKGIYNNLARWCNQPNFFKKQSFREFCEYNEKFNKCTLRYMKVLEDKHPDIAEKYFDLKYRQYNNIVQ